MARVAVICGTGMSELTNDFRRKKDCTITELRIHTDWGCLLYTSPSPRDAHESRMPSSA